MKTVTITQKLAEEILDQLEGAQKDCYVQSTENVISDLKQALRIHDAVGQSEQLQPDEEANRCKRCNCYGCICDAVDGI